MPTEEFYNTQTNQSLVPQDLLQLSPELHEKYVEQLSKTAPRDIDGVKKWLSAYGQAVQSSKNGFDLYSMWKYSQDSLIKFPIVSEPSKETINDLYKEMKKFARMNDLKSLLQATKKSHKKFQRSGLKIGVGISSFLIFGGIIYLLMNKK